MIEKSEFLNTVEKVVLVAVSLPRVGVDKTKEYLEELSFLVETAGGLPDKHFVQNMQNPDPKFYVGSGKLEEIRQYVEDNEIEVVVFDDELSPSQTRNIEKIIPKRIIDRTRLILDIFSSRAQTSYAKTQVELAQYQYLLPRLTRMWTHLEKQRGGIGMRGPGEKEIETDRRIVRDRIAFLKKKLLDIDKQKNTQRRNRGSFVRVSLVGYTNVGKSTLMNLLSKSDVFAENKLFATLDTTVRKVVIDTLPFLLSDTVGFIRKLPHGLIESFKSTLDEIRESDIVLHVVDISHPEFEEQIEVVNQTLSEIGASQIKSILIFNKIDNYTYVEKEEDDLTEMTKENISLDDLKNTWFAKSGTDTIFISAKTKENIDELRQLLYKEIRNIHNTIYPYNRVP